MVRRAAALAGLVAGLALTAPPAPAAPDVQTGLADDAVFLHRPAKAPRIVARWRALGVDAVRVHARWIVIGPHPHARRPPRGFDASDHTSPLYNWRTLDLAVRLLLDNGIEPIVSITGSGPLWTSAEPSRRNHRFKPDPAAFGDFAAAVARRYEGRVRRYIIWNEPNQAAWLQPQFTCDGARCTPFAPHHYRRLYRAGYRAVKAVDREADVYVGALAPRGRTPSRRNAPVRPLTFLRAMSCVSESYRRLRGHGCTRAAPLRADGLAYHPHGVDLSPSGRSPHPDDDALGDLGRLKAVVDRSVARGILRHRGAGPLPIHLTEYAYQTNPPDRAVGVPPARQARYLAQAAYITWRDPRVKTVLHYAWRDERVSRKAPRGPRRYASWQSGLLFRDNRAKPALAVFPHPLWVTTRTDGLVRLWGHVRTGEGRREVSVQRRLRGGSGWSPVLRTRTDRHGVWTATVVPPKARSADYRFTYVLGHGEAGAPDRAVRRKSSRVATVARPATARPSRRP
jgi:hypothetical protein